MARSQTRKLLLNEDDRFSCFFDLEKDPNETTNLIKDPEYANEIAALKDALMRWMLFDSRTPLHVDEGAALCSGENVVAEDQERRDDMAAYMREKITPALR